mmetsp:Transcript_11193/g.14475  ORF Transcript_11193/g.14475 Transcript_11193/m.14475 type:complete len:106 (+) Transcript_11193:230-547(+)
MQSVLEVLVVSMNVLILLVQEEDASSMIQRRLSLMGIVMVVPVISMGFLGLLHSKTSYPFNQYSQNTYKPKQKTAKLCHPLVVIALAAYDHLLLLPHPPITCQLR